MFHLHGLHDEQGLTTQDLLTGLGADTGDTAGHGGDQLVVPVFNSSWLSKGIPKKHPHPSLFMNGMQFFFVEEDY